MATNMDKGLYQAPQGLQALADEPETLVEMLTPGEEDAEGGVEVLIGEEGPQDADDEHEANLAEKLDEGTLASIANELVADFDEDLASRRDWIRTYVEALDLLALQIEERTEPWEGACGVIHPLLAEAVVRFQAEVMTSSFPAAGPVKTKIIGRETPEKKESSLRVQEDMNHQLTDEMPEFRPEHERMLWGLGLSGNAFKKVYYDSQLKRQVSRYVSAEDIVIPYGASDLQTCERVTHVMRKTPNDVRKLQVSGFYRDVDLGEPMSVLDEIEKKIAARQGFSAVNDTRFKLLEMQVDLDLPGYEHRDDDGEVTGIKLPYVVTVERHTLAVLAIRRNWQQGDDTYTKRQHLVHYGLVPGFGFYCFGYAHLVGAYSQSATSVLRQLVDAGTLANLPGGFKARGMRVKDDGTPIGPGEWRDADVPSGTLRDNLVPLPYKEPSPSLITLLDKMVEEGRRFANTADLQISDMSAQAPVGTTLAILERTLKTMSAVQARIHYSTKQELKLLKDLIAEYAPEDYDYDPDVGPRRARRSDYENVDVIPVSDPNASTMAQKIVQYQASFQLAQTAPQLYNLPLLHREMQEVLGLKNAAKIIPLPEDMVPTDPVSENQNVLMGKPVKAFLTQDHEAHIAVHMAAIQDPKLQQLMQMNPQAQQLLQAMMAHVNEHLGFAYRRQIEQQLGMALPPQTDENGEDVPMDPRVEAQLAPLLAGAAQRLLQQNQQQVAQQQAAQQAQDPLVQLQKDELALKAKKQADDAAATAERLRIDREKAEADKQIRNRQIDADLLKAAGQTVVQHAQHGRASNLDALKHTASLAQQDRHHASDADERRLQAMQQRLEQRKQQGGKPKKGDE